MCYLSITSKTFLNACKVAKPKPIFKKVKKTGPSDDRPLSLFVLFSEVLEKVIQDKTNTFLKENNLLYNY